MARLSGARLSGGASAVFCDELLLAECFVVIARPVYSIISIINNSSSKHHCCHRCIVCFIIIVLSIISIDEVIVTRYSRMSNRS